MPKKNFMTLRAFFGCQITIFWRPSDPKSKILLILGLFWTCKLVKSWNMVIFHAPKIDPKKDFWKKILMSKIFSVPKFGKKQVFIEYSSRKMISLPLLKLTDLDQIFTGGTWYHGLRPCKISFKSEQFKYQKLRSKIKNRTKMTPKIVFELVTLL